MPDRDAPGTRLISREAIWSSPPLLQHRSAVVRPGRHTMARRGRGPRVVTCFRKLHGLPPTVWNPTCHKIWDRLPDWSSATYFLAARSNGWRRRS